MVDFGGIKGVRVLQELYLKDKTFTVIASLGLPEACGDLAYPTPSNTSRDFQFLHCTQHSPNPFVCKFTYLS